jgi:ParB-like chromosome segregation protein Spo0J
MTTKTLPNLRFIPISQIKIGDRHRKHFGDLESLAASIEKGLLQPIGVSPEMDLIWGLRRLVATRDVLEKDQILCRVVSVDSIVQGEFDENTLRKDFTPSERIAIVENLRGYDHGGDRKSDQGRNCDLDRLTTKAAAERVGFCRDDYFRAKKVVLKGTPELVEAMDSGRLSISAASELAGSHPEEQRRVLATVKDENGWVVRGMRKSLKRAKRRMAIERTEGRQVEPPGDGDIKIYHCPFQKLEEVAGIEPGSVNLILTDIPYCPEFLPEVSDLGAFAARALVEGGLLVTYSGVLYLNQVIRSLDEHLKWAWSAASVWMGEASIILSRNVTGKWKPILIYSMGEWRKRSQWPDVLIVNSKEKEWHPQQEPLEEVEMLVRYFSVPGDLVVDTCGGGFTTAVACRNLGRRCISCDIDSSAVVRGQDRLAGKSPGLAG